MFGCGMHHPRGFDHARRHSKATILGQSCQACMVRQTSCKTICPPLRPLRTSDPLIPRFTKETQTCSSISSPENAQTAYSLRPLSVRLANTQSPVTKDNKSKNDKKDQEVCAANPPARRPRAEKRDRTRQAIRGQTHRPGYSDGKGEETRSGSGRMVLPLSLLCHQKSSGSWEH